MPFIQPSTRKFLLSTPFLYTLMIVLGIFSGLSDIPGLKPLGLFIADVFIRIFKCISLPIIALSIIVTLTSYRADGAMKRVWQRAMTYTLVTTVIAAAISCLLYLLIQPSMINAPAAKMTGLIPNQSSYFDHISSLIPSTIFAPFLDHQVMGVLLLGIVTGIAIRYIPEQEPRQTITAFFRGAHGLFMVITGWVIKIIPLGLYGFITSTVVQLREGQSIRGLGGYLLIIVLANLIQGLVVLPLWLKSQGIKPFAALRGMLPALSVAFSPSRRLVPYR